MVHLYLTLENDPPYGSSVVYIDPANEFLARSVDSYLSKKVLLELKLISIKLDDITQLENKLGTSDVRLRVKIWVGDVFWATSPFTFAKLKGRALSCNMKQVYRLRVDTEVCKFVTVMLCAIDNNADRLSDALKSLRQEAQLGYSQISLSQIDAQSKTHFVPLDNQVYSELPYMKADVPKVSLSMQLLNNVKLVENLDSRKRSRSGIIRKGIQHQRLSHIHRRTRTPLPTNNRRTSKT